MRLEAYLREAASRLVYSDSPQLDMRVLARSALGLADADLILAGDRFLSAIELARLEAMVQRRLGGESVAHIVGEKEFYGLSFRLAPGVLSPRPDTETLIGAALRRFDRNTALRILDLGVGSGAVLCALLHVFPKATGIGADRRLEAAALARENAARLGLLSRAAFICGDWASSLAGAFDLIVSNPPYIATCDIEGLPPEIRLFEDPLALDGGADGLDAYRGILPMAAGIVSSQGAMIVEFGFGQEAALVELAGRCFGKRSLTVENDLAGRPRVLVVEPMRQKNI